VNDTYAGTGEADGIYGAGDDLLSGGAATIT
jgi:hypothetical protein